MVWAACFAMAIALAAVGYGLGICIYKLLMRLPADAFMIDRFSDKKEP